MAELFGKNVRTISEHIRNIFKEKELDDSSVIRNFRITARDGKVYETQFYNLDVIVSVGYPGQVQTRHPVSNLGDSDAEGPLAARLYPQSKAAYGKRAG